MFISGKLRSQLVCGAAIWALGIGAANAQSVQIALNDQALGEALKIVAEQTGQSILFPPKAVDGVRARSLHGKMTAHDAVARLIAGTNLDVASDGNGGFVVRPKPESVAAVTVPKKSAYIRPLEAAPAEDLGGAATNTESVVVTGSRIVNGNNLPTPVTILSAEQLQTVAPQSIPDALNKLPEFNSTSTPNNRSNNNGKGVGTGNYLNLRGLSPIRTLILQDGNRVPGTSFDTTVDVDMLPQLLIKRVDVVKGGVSAVYGSDAVTGVVNFVTDNHFNGIKGLFQVGESTYNDARSLRAGVAWGMDVLDRGHVEFSAEYTIRDAVPDTGTRPYGLLGAETVGSGTAAKPYTLAFDVRQSNVASGGLVTTGPFKGQQFLPNGQLGAFNAGTPTATANLATGGDGGWTHNEYLLPVENKGQVFGRFDYDFSDSLSAYVSARYALVRNFEAPQTIESIPGGYPITVFSGNPYLTAGQQATLAATGTSSFQMSRWSYELGRRVGLRTNTGALSITSGLNGAAWGDFTWDAHYTHGESRTLRATNNNINTRRFYAALDAVTDPKTGKTICNTDLTAPGLFPGCAPFNPFGAANESQASIDYISGPTSWTAHNGLDDFGANLTGTLFDGWAGPVKAAVGAEYRLASLGVTATVSGSDFDPSGLRLAPYGTYNAGNFGTAATNPTGSYPSANQNWFKPDQSPGSGSENVSEGNFEIDVPLAKDLPLIELLSFNGAYRYTQYSAAGNGTRSAFSANTWKMGLEWQVFDDLRLRAARSRDIRAPTLWDLYQQPLNAPSDATDPLTSTGGRVIVVTGGNPNLKAEVARNTTAGAVYTPSWFPGFSVSVDYYKISIGNGIGSVNGLSPAVQKLCLASPGGSSPYCDLVVRPISYNNTSPANYPTLAYNLNQNVASIHVEGVDLEASYQADLSEFSGMNGIVNLRLLLTHQPTLKTQSIQGATVTNDAGASLGIPVDKLAFNVGYNLGDLNFNVQERFFSPVHQFNDPTLVDNTPHVPAYFQTDIDVSYNFVAADTPITGFLNIANLFNAQGGIVNQPVALPGLRYPTTPYADVVGRYFTIGVRFKN
jgi:outer membrane receptor protein involved in Fe transport